MKNLINTIKLFFRTPSMYISYFLMIFINNYLMYKIVSSFQNAAKQGRIADSMYFYGDMGVLCFVLMVVPMFMGFEWIRKSRNCSIKVIAKTTKQVNIIELNQIIVMCILFLLHILNIGTCLVLGFWKYGMNNMVISEIVRIFICDFLLLPFAAFAMGILMSHIKNRYVGYSLIVAVCMCCLPTTEIVLSNFYKDTKLPVYILSDFFNMIPPDMTATYDPLYGFPTEEYRILEKLIWIITAILFEIFCYMKGREKWKRFVCFNSGLICVVLIGFNIINKGSVLRMDNYAKSGVVETYSYYSKNNQNEKTADFSISTYNMELCFEKELCAKVEMNIKEKCVLDKYIFTLHHGYQIESIKNEKDELLEYERCGDYFTVKNDSKKRIEKINIIYTGHSETFYSNSKACFLPGMFPYYPKAGFWKIYNEGYVGAKTNVSNFIIKTKGLSVYSSLNQEGKIHKGRATNVTLLSGYYKKLNQGNVKVIFYPLNGLSKEIAECIPNSELQKNYKKLCEYLDLPIENVFKDKNIVLIPASLTFNSVLKSFYEFENYILLGDSATEYDVLDSLVPINEKKKNLRSEFFYQQPSNEIDLSDDQLYMDEYSGAEYEEYMEIHDLFVKKSKEMGMRQFAKKVIKYLMDDNVTMTDIEYMRKLK